MEEEGHRLVSSGVSAAAAGAAGGAGGGTPPSVQWRLGSSSSISSSRRRDMNGMGNFLLEKKDKSLCCMMSRWLIRS
ncbi:hypothetical protein Emag_007680 [Eimeria magna]